MAIVRRDGTSTSLQPWLERMIVSMALLALLATSLRIISRRLNRQALWWDDWLAIWSMVRYSCHLYSPKLGGRLRMHKKALAQS